jgi:phenylalanyl-tRNA synthetase beta chain
LEYRIIDKNIDFPVTKPFDLSRSAIAYAAGTEIILGIIGEFTPKARKQLKLPVASAGFEIGLQELLASQSHKQKYRPLSRFPAVTQDICLQVPAGTSYAVVAGLFSDSITSNTPADQTADWHPIDIYSSVEIGNLKRFTFRITLRSHERTLTEEVLTKLLDKVLSEMQKSLEVTKI